MGLRAGQVLQKRYRVLSLLGQGGMGAVYRAYDTRLGIEVAIKEMVPQPGIDPRTLAQLREQFRQEAMVLARLRHPNLVRVTDFFEEGENAYLVMEFVEGESLAERIEREGPLPEREVLRIAHQLLDALAYCHSQRVIHRDIKPQNVILRPDGQVVLVDFGLVKLWDPRHPQTRTVIRSMGTPGYAPPEQYDVAMGYTDPRSDIYSLGATLYHALTGQAPLPVTVRIVTPEAFRSPREMGVAVSPHVETAVMRALSLRPADRFGSAEEMRRGLLGLAPAAPAPYPTVQIPSVVREPPMGRELPIPREPSGRPDRRMYIWGIGILLVVGLCLGASLLFLLLSPPAHTPVTPASTSSTPPAATSVSFMPPFPTSTPASPAATSPAVKSESFGQSVMGRSLNVTWVEAGNDVAVVLVGSIQGDQLPTKDLVEALIEYFKQNPERVPSGSSFHFIPTLNPDGNANHSRFNAHGVDLNRNWDTKDWRANPAVPGYPNGKEGAGGASPFSEPETRALRDYLLRLQGRYAVLRVVVLHSSTQRSKGEVYPGGKTGVGIASAYASATGYDIKTAWAEYTTSGELVTWCDENGIASIDVVFPASQSPYTRVSGNDTLLDITVRGLLEISGR